MVFPLYDQDDNCGERRLPRASLAIEGPPGTRFGLLVLVKAADALGVGGGIGLFGALQVSGQDGP